MDLIRLLSHGYFPKEITPFFSTINFANKIDAISKEWDAINWQSLKPKKKIDYLETRYIDYNVPKGGLRFSRRNLNIPNPLSQWLLSKCIVDDWTEISKCLISTTSASLPVFSFKGNRSIRTKLTYGEFRRSGILDSYGKIYEVKTDIAKYYSSIYTHSIPWAMHTKAVAKVKRNDMTLVGNKIDKCVRQCQSGQTMGIPVGPDTSIVVSEIIGCWIDSEFHKRMPHYVGYRYTDDFILYFSNKQYAEKAIRVLQEILTYLGLEMNDLKTSIKRSPHFVDNGWSYTISNYVFSNEDRRQNADLVQFFELSFKYAVAFPSDSVMKYAMSIAGRLTVSAVNWQLYESLLMKTVITEPSTINDFSVSMYRNRSRVTLHKIQEVVRILLEEHIYKGHSFEVAWALWLAHMFKINISDEVDKDLFDLQDAVVLLQSLYLRSVGIISKELSIEQVMYYFDGDSLNGEYWLLVYEAIFHKWVSSDYDKLVDEHPFFSILKKHGVTFVDTNALATRKLVAKNNSMQALIVHRFEDLVDIDLNSYF